MLHGGGTEARDAESSFRSVLISHKQAAKQPGASGATSCQTYPLLLKEVGHTAMYCMRIRER